MNLLGSSWSDWDRLGASSVTIGVFDGVHRGHRALISRLNPDLRTTVLTFDPHPVEVLLPGTPPRLITTLEERYRILDAIGLDQVGVLDLSEIKGLSPEEFVASVLVDRLDMRHLVLGPDFRFGKDRTGDVDLLAELGGQHGFELEVLPLVSDDEGPISSSRIRAMIEGGEVARAAEHLTSRFTVTGPVIHGDKRGASIGYPTANLVPPPRKVLPAMGVYAAFAHIGGVTERAAVNIGRRPTFGGGDVLIEAYIMDFDEEIYGELLTVELVQYLREELDFDRVADLVEQMGEDVAVSAKLLESTASNVG